MTRIQPLPIDEADSRAQSILDATKKKFGKYLNFFKTLANSSAVLDGYTSLSGALSTGSLSPKTREQIAVAISNKNGCEYCLTAHGHAAVASGVSASELAPLLDGITTDAKEQAAIVFANRVFETQGRVENADLEAVRNAGYSESDILEIIAHVSMTFFSNALNNVSKTEVDIPPLSIQSGLQTATR